MLKNRLPSSLARHTCFFDASVTLSSQPWHILPKPEQLSLRFASSSSSSTRWKSRQTRDSYARDAKVAGLKSRAAYKLLEINDKYKLFRRGNTVVDLGYAPGSWSQVAVNRTAPGGRVVGIDIIPAQPPKGASSIQGNFLSPEIQEEVRRYVQDYMRGRPRKKMVLSRREEDSEGSEATEEEMERQPSGYVEMERHMDDESQSDHQEPDGKKSQHEADVAAGRVVDVVLSDMSAPWEQTNSLWVRSVSNPWNRMMNTSGMPFRDHAGSMDLCNAALTFCYNTLRTGGHFLCKFYQGSEDHDLEMRLKKLFEKVHRIKPESSRSESKEAYLVGLRRKADVPRELVLGEG